MHYLAGVIVKNNDENEVRKVLEPYQEYDGTEETRKYAVFEDCDKENRELWEKEYKDKYSSYEDFLKSDDAEGDLTEDGRRGYWNNPNAKWDWYKLGGRWDERLVVNGAHTNSGKISELTFEQDPKAYQIAKRQWEIIVEGQKPTKEDENERELQGFLLPKKYLLKFYEDKEAYARFYSGSLPYCLFAPDGEYFERNSGNEKAGAFEKRVYDILKKYENCYLFYVDLHI